MKFIIAIPLLIASSPVFALNADDFDDLEGYTVSAVTKVDGDFEGCEYDRKIKLQNGWVLTCQNYKYHYAYSPTIAVLSRDVGNGFVIKAVIDDEIYDMEPIIKR